MLCLAICLCECGSNVSINKCKAGKQGLGGYKPGDNQETSSFLFLHAFSYFHLSVDLSAVFENSLQRK